MAAAFGVLLIFDSLIYYAETQSAWFMNLKSNIAAYISKNERQFVIGFKPNSSILSV